MKMPSCRAAARPILTGLLLLSWMSIPRAIAGGVVLTSGQVDFCRIIYGCKLGIPPAGLCPTPKELGPPPFAYDDARCLEARTLQSRGVGPAHPVVGFQLYRFLGMEYRVVYEVADTIPVSGPRLEYLLNDLPLSAKLVSHYQKQSYTALYTDAAHSHFQGTKGSHLRGEARLISGSTSEKRLFYFGSGTVEVAYWKLTGPCLMDFTYWPIPGKPRTLGYKMKILVFPGNGFVNKIMNLGLFRKIVFGKIREVLKDISETANKLNASGGADIQNSPAWNPVEKQKVNGFFKLP